MNTNSSTGATDAYIVNVVKQYQVNGVPLGTADLVNTADFTTASEVQSDWLQTDSTQARYIRNKPTLAAVATSGSAADLTTGVLPLSTIPQLPAPTISSGNFQIGSFAVDILPTVDSAQNIGRAGAAWKNIVAQTLALGKTSASTPLDVVGQATVSGSTLPQIHLVNPSATADGTEPACIGFDCTAQGQGQEGTVGFATTRGLFARIGGVDRLNISVSGDTSISGALTGASTANHQLGNLLVSDFGTNTPTLKYAGIGNAAASSPAGGLLIGNDGSLRINAAANASIFFQSRYSTIVNMDAAGNFFPNTANGPSVGTSSYPWGAVNTAVLNCSSQMTYQSKALQPIATSGSAGDLNNGIAPLARIPPLPAGQITSGTYTVGSFGVAVCPSLDMSYNLGTTTTRWKDANVYSLDVKGYATGGSSSTNLGINCGGPVSVNSGFGVTAHDQTASSTSGNATIIADVFQSYYDPSAHTFGTSYTGCTDGYGVDTALWRHKTVGSVATSNAASNIQTVYALKQSSVGVTTLNAASSQSVNLSIANSSQVVLTTGVMRPATNAALDLGSTSYYYRSLYATNATISGTFNLMPSGTILQYAAVTAPAGFLACDGSSYSTTTYSALYAVIGTTFGSGSGTFNVPNLLGRVSVMRNPGDSNFGNLGGSGGESAHTLSTGELPSHSHGVSDPGHGHPVTDPSHGHGVSDPGHIHGLNGTTGATGLYSAIQFANSKKVDMIVPAGSGAGTTSQTTGVSVSGSYTGVKVTNAGTSISIAATGSSSSHNNLQPYLVVLYIIKT